METALFLPHVPSSLHRKYLNQVFTFLCGYSSPTTFLLLVLRPFWSCLQPKLRLMGAICSSVCEAGAVGKKKTSASPISTISRVSLQSEQPAEKGEHRRFPLCPYSPPLVWAGVGASTRWKILELHLHSGLREGLFTGTVRRRVRLQGARAVRWGSESKAYGARCRGRRKPTPRRAGPSPVGCWAGTGWGRLGAWPD